MKKTLLQSLLFPMLWLLYCAFLLITQPDMRTAQAAGSLLVGMVFLWGTGFLLLLAVGRSKLKTRGLVLWGVALTESRTALLTLVLGVGFLTLRRPTFVQRGARWAVQALFVFYRE